MLQVGETVALSTETLLPTVDRTLLDCVPDRVHGLFHIHLPVLVLVGIRQPAALFLSRGESPSLQIHKVPQGRAGAGCSGGWRPAQTSNKCITACAVYRKNSSA